MTGADNVAALPRAIERFAAMLDRAPDGAVQVPGLTWNVSQLGAHVLSGARLYRQMSDEHVNGWRDVRDGAAENARIMDELAPERDVHEIARLLPEEATRLRTTWEKLGPDTRLPWHGELVLPVSVIAGMVLGDVNVHGVDLARATKQSWTIGGEDAAAAFGALTTVAPAFVDDAAAGFVGTFDIALRSGPRYGFAFDRGTLNISDGKPHHAACRLVADPATLVLIVYGRVTAVRAAATAKVFAYGWKPWLAFKLPSLIRNP